eukprot:6193004-Pleurochrysis_carterae.AAC.12
MLEPLACCTPEGQMGARVHPPMEERRKARAHDAYDMRGRMLLAAKCKLLSIPMHLNLPFLPRPHA